MRLFGLKNCDTCRKVLKTLNHAGHSVAFVDVRNDGIAASDMRRFHAEFGEKLINTRSTTWRGLSEIDRNRNPLELLAEYPALMKRPVIDGGDSMTIGWDKAVAKHWQAG